MRTNTLKQSSQGPADGIASEGQQEVLDRFDSRLRDTKCKDFSKTIAQHSSWSSIMNMARETIKSKTKQNSCSSLLRKVLSSARQLRSE